MYMDRHLEYERIGKDASGTTTREIPFGQFDLEPLPNAGTTADTSPDARLFFMVIAGGNAVAKEFTVELQHSDTKGGTYTTVAKYGPTADVANPGDIIFSEPVPQGIKAWTRVVKSADTPVNIFLTYDVVPKSLPTFPR